MKNVRKHVNFSFQDVVIDTFLIYIYHIFAFLKIRLYRRTRIRPNRRIDENLHTFL